MGVTGNKGVKSIISLISDRSKIRDIESLNERKENNNEVEGRFLCKEWSGKTSLTGDT